VGGWGASISLSLLSLGEWELRVRERDHLFLRREQAEGDGERPSLSKET